MKLLLTLNLYYVMVIDFVTTAIFYKILSDKKKLELRRVQLGYRLR